MTSLASAETRAAFAGFLQSRRDVAGADRDQAEHDQLHHERDGEIAAAHEERVAHVKHAAEHREQERTADRQEQRGGRVHEDVHRGELRVRATRDVHDARDEQQVVDELEVEESGASALAIELRAHE